MSKTRRTLLKASLGLGAASVLPFPMLARASEKISMKCGTNVPMTHPIYLRLQEASEKILKDSDGRVQFKIFPNGQLGGDTEMLSQTRSGSLEFVTMPGVVLANLTKMASLNSVGFAFDNYPEVWKAMDGELGQFIREYISKANLMVFDKVWDNGFRHITSRNPIQTVEDLQGVKIRVPVSAMLLSIFKSIGSSPTSLNFSELYSALQTHIMDAQENPLPIIYTGKLYEVQPNLALTGHAWDGYWLLSSKRIWEKLPQEIQQMLSLHLNAAAMEQRKDSEKLGLDLQAELASKGMNTTTPDKDSFRSKLAQGGYYAEWKKKMGNEAWAILEKSTGRKI